jgi:hypothetical protein
MPRKKGVVENPDGTFVLKACGGDRSANLESIADKIDEMFLMTMGISARKC